MPRLVSGRFELLRQVGEGGAGVVFEAHDLDTNSHVAVKLLHSGNAAAEERFVTEIAVLSELPHPAIVRYIGHGTTDDGRQYLVMEWLAGKTVDEHRVGQWSVAETLTLARRVVAGLGFAAMRGISHRDIKPANLFLVNDDVENAKILDFGLAQRSEGAAELTGTGSVVGTPQYMSPEQTRGDIALDARTDVFSLGSVLYACLCGRPPFLAQQASAILEQICVDEPMPIEERAPQVPLRLRSVVQAMMRKDREERPTWSAIAAELSEIADQHVELDAAPLPNLERGPSVVPRAPRRVRGDYRIMVAAFMAPDGDNTYRKELDDIATQHGVRVTKLTDGTLMVLPAQHLPTSDQAVVAARAALALQRALSEPCAIVVCTGRAALSDNAQPVGELIEHAASLLAGAGPRAVYVDTPSAALLEARFELGGMELEGTRRTLVRERSGVEAARTLLGQASPFLGRERELSQLRAAFDDCVARRQARPLLVTAPAGAGKSRLLQEFLLQLRAAGSDFTLLAGRGDPMRGGTQFGVLAFALHSWAELASCDDPAQKRKKFCERVSQLAPDAPLLPQFLGEMIGLPFHNDAGPQLKAARLDHQLMADRMLESWLLFCDVLGAHKPTLFCIEDVQFADPASVRFIDAALRSSQRRALLVLALARPEVHETHPQLWAERELVEVQLPKLDASASTRLLQQLAGAPVEPALQAALLERADGNPFFLEELVRGLATRQRGQSLPETILAVVQARLADLGDAAKRLIEAASIFGQSFRLPALRALIDLPFDFEAALAELSQREIVVGSVDTQDEYAFRHALLREAAYLLQPDDERVHGHCQAAAWLERAHEAPAQVADHYERGGERARAGEWWARAATQAFEVGSLDDALRFGARAVSCGLEGAQLSQLALVLAEARSYFCDDAGAIAWADRARGSFPAQTAEWWRASQIGSVVRLRSAAPNIEAVTEPMLEHFDPHSALPDQALAIMYTISESLRVVRDDVAERFLALLPKLRPEALAGRPEGCLASARARKAYRTGNLSAALRFGRVSLDVMRNAGALRDTCDMLNLCGYLLHELGVYAESESLLVEATQLGHRIGSPNDVYYGQLNLGSSYVRQARYDEAERTLMAAWQGFQKLALVSFQGEALGHLVEVQRARGELERARQTAERALQLDSLEAAPTALLLARLAAVDLSAGLTDEALEHAQSAHELVREQGVSEFVGLIAVSHVESLQAAGSLDDARAVLTAALSWIDEQAAKIDDPTLQRSFLEHVPEHARLRELAMIA